MPVLSMREGNRGRFIPNFVEEPWAPTALDLHDNNALATGGDCGAQLRAERRTPTQCLRDPDAPALHLGDLSGNGETGPRTSLGAHVRAVSLAEFLEDPLALFSWDAGAGR
jgi:hypothetical protein